jgi:hypothetical protein
MFTESLLTAALTFSAWYGDIETSGQRQARLETIASAINIATLHAVCSEDAPEFPSAQGRPQAGENDSDESAQDEPSSACIPLWSGSPRRLAFLLLTQAYFETRLAAHIHEGRCRVSAGECDGGRATSLWQLHYGPQLSKEHWQKLSGTDLSATTLAAYEAARALSRGYNHCRSLAGAISLYATGRTCQWAPAKKRVEFLTRLSERY